MLACMVSHKPAAASEIRTDLIVASPSLIRQWRNEIKKHVRPEEFKGILLYHGRSEVMEVDLDLMKSASIVLTTYQAVQRSFFKFNPPAEIFDRLEAEKWYRKVWNEKSGLLHKVCLRIVHWQHINTDR